MKIQFLGTAAAEGIPALFCDCETCKRSRKAGGKNIRSRSQAIVDDTLLIDFPADTFMHFINFDIPMQKIKSCVITHSHSDHLYVNDIANRKKGYANLDDKVTPLTFYSAKSGYEMISEIIQNNGMEETEVKAQLIKPFETFFADGYEITGLRASHSEEASSVLYIIEKDGKSIFYSHDTGEYCEETYNFLKARRKPLSLVSFDCTCGCDHHDFCGSHMSLECCAGYRKKFLEDGIADKKTIFIVNHFSHNASNVMYDDFVPIAKEEGFLVTYDGMQVVF